MCLKYKLEGRCNKTFKKLLWKVSHSAGNQTLFNNTNKETAYQIINIKRTILLGATFLSCFEIIKIPTVKGTKSYGRIYAE